MTLQSFVVAERTMMSRIQLLLSSRSKLERKPLVTLDMKGNLRKLPPLKQVTQRRKNGSKLELNLATRHSTAD
jgi:hypothetical protein